MATIHQMPPRGHYLAVEVGRLAGVSGRTIGQWARRGYIRSSQSCGVPRIYSFQDVAEAVVVHELLDEGLTHRKILAFVSGLREIYGDWPLTMAPIAVGADPGDRPWRELFLLDNQEGAYQRVDGNWQQAHVTKLRRVADALRRGGWATRKLHDLQHIEVDPDRLSGRPTIRGRRVSAEQVARIAVQPGGRAILEEDYDLSGTEIDDAVRWWSATEVFAREAA